jgi:hypothetical protein
LRASSLGRETPTLCPAGINRAHIIAGLLRNLDSGLGDSFLGAKINFP